MALKGAVECLVSSAAVCSSEQTMTCLSFNVHVLEGINTHTHTHTISVLAAAEWVKESGLLVRSCGFQHSDASCGSLCPQRTRSSSASSSGSITQTICLFWKAELTNYSNIPAADVFMSELVMGASGKSDGW